MCPLDNVCPQSSVNKDLCSVSLSMSVYLHAQFWRSRACAVVDSVNDFTALTAVGGDVLTLLGLLLPLFLLRSSFTGSLTRTPWYGLEFGGSAVTVGGNKSRKKMPDGSLNYMK